MSLTFVVCKRYNLLTKQEARAQLQPRNACLMHLVLPFGIKKRKKHLLSTEMTRSLQGYVLPIHPWCFCNSNAKLVAKTFANLRTKQRYLPNCQCLVQAFDCTFEILTRWSAQISTKKCWQELQHSIKRRKVDVINLKQVTATIKTKTRTQFFELIHNGANHITNSQ